MDLLDNAVKETKTRIDTLKKSLSDADKKGVTSKNSEQYRKLQREIVEAENKLKSFKAQQKAFGTVAQQQLKAVGRKYQELGTKIKTAGSKMSGLSMGLTIFGGLAVSTTTEFDTAMSKVQAISGATGEEFDALREKARSMGEKTKFSATESAEAFNYMAMAGWKTEDMLDGIEGVMQLASASGEDLATTSDIVTDGLTAMGLSAKDSGRFADVLASASANANTNVSLMGETFKYASPVAGALGYSIEDLALATGLMANAGIKGSQAGTSLRSMMSRLSAPTDAVQSAMTQLGISLTDSEGNMKPMRQTLYELRDSMSGLSETEQTAMASTIAGKNAMSGFLAIINASDKDFNKLANAVDNASGSAEDMSEVMMDNLGGQVTILKSQLQELAISMGDTLVPIVKKVISVVQKLVDKYNGLSDRVKQVITVMLLIAGAIAPVIIVVGALASCFGSLITLIANVPTYLTAIKNALTVVMGAISPVVVIIAGIIALLVVLYKTNDTFRNAVNKAISSIKASFLVLWKQLKPALQNLASTLLPIIKKVLNVIGRVLAKLIPIITRVITTTIVRISRVIGFMNKLLSTIKTVGGKIYNLLASPFERVKNTIGGIVETIKSKLSALKDYKWLKAPHLTIKGGKVPFGIGGEGEKPHIGIEWYAKAMKNGMILNSATIFGASGGKLLGGGEAGSETVVGTNSLMGMISNAVATSINNMSNNVASALSTGLQVGLSGSNMGGSIYIDNYLFKNGDSLGRTIVNTYDTYSRRLK